MIDEELEEDLVSDGPEIKEEVKSDDKKKPLLTKAQELEIFKSLAYKSYKDVGYEYGFQHFYDSDSNVTGAVFSIARKIRKAPELWGLSQDALEVIDEAIASRSVKNNPRVKSDIAILEESFRDRLDVMRDKVADLIMQKLAEFERKGGLSKVSIRDLKDLLIMAIDKGKLLKDGGVENVVKFAKTDIDNLSPDDALKVIMKARDALVEGRK